MRKKIGTGYETRPYSVSISHLAFCSSVCFPAGLRGPLRFRCKLPIVSARSALGCVEGSHGRHVHDVAHLITSLHDLNGSTQSKEEGAKRLGGAPTGAS